MCVYVYVCIYYIYIYIYILAKHNNAIVITIHSKLVIFIQTLSAVHGVSPDRSRAIIGTRLVVLPAGRP